MGIIRSRKAAIMAGQNHKAEREAKPASPHGPSRSGQVSYNLKEGWALLSAVRIDQGVTTAATRKGLKPTVIPDIRGRVKLRAKPARELRVRIGHF